MSSTLFTIGHSYKKNRKAASNKGGFLKNLHHLCKLFWFYLFQQNDFYGCFVINFFYLLHIFGETLHVLVLGHNLKHLKQVYTCIIMTILAAASGAYFHLFTDIFSGSICSSHLFWAFLILCAWLPLSPQPRRQKRKELVNQDWATLWI